MINLLPAQELEAIMYARRNTKLLTWLLISLLSIVGIVLMVGGGLFIINRSADQVATQVQIGQQQLKQQKLDETQARVEDISSSLKLATQVLSRQVILSELIPHIGSVLPEGTSLSGLQLNKIEGGIDLSIAAKDYQTATQAQVNLASPDNKIFDKADINNINCAGNDDPRYACVATIRALFAKDNPYSFLNQGKTP